MGSVNIPPAALGTGVLDVGVLNRGQTTGNASMLENSVLTPNWTSHPVHSMT